MSKFIVIIGSAGYCVRARHNVSGYQGHPTLAQVFQSKDQAEMAADELKNNGFTEVKICSVVEGEKE